MALVVCCMASTYKPVTGPHHHYRRQQHHHNHHQHHRWHHHHHHHQAAAGGGGGRTAIKGRHRWPLILHKTSCRPLIRHNLPLRALPENLRSFQDFSVNNELSQFDLGKLVGCFLPVVLAVCLSHSLKTGLEKDMQIAIFRCTAQLILSGLVLKFLFEGERILMSVCAVILMIFIAGHTAGDRAKDLPNSHVVATLSLALGALGTLVLMLMLRIFPIQSQFIIPTAGYVIGNSMSMVGSTLQRLHNDIKLHQGQIEAALALGASPHQAVQKHVQRAVIQGMGPMIDSLKTTGLISLPGSMTGMLMGGSSPLAAVQMQLQILYMLLGCAAVCSIVSSYLGWHMLFTRSYQLILT